MARLDAFFKLMFDTGASDLHIVAGQPPILRVHGELERVKYDPLDDENLRAMLYEIAPEQKIKVFEETGDIDFGYEIPGVARFRANFFMQRVGCGAVFRQIPTKINTADELGLPPILKRTALLNKGLVLVTGPTGSGKSTTLAAIVDHANKNRKDHIVTIEDPIEFVHPSHGCLVNHREVGDLETIRLAIEASNTGHLVFGTLHTSSATKTIDRVIEVFPAEEQAQIRNGLSTGLKVVCAQNLFKRVDKKGRCAALEILVCTPAVSNLIRENKTVQIPSAIQTGKQHGMQTLDDAIMEVLNKKWISPEEAYQKCIDKSKFRPFLKNPPDELNS